MPRKHQHDMLHDKELRNKYHIRKFSAGIASVLFGTLVYTSLDHQAQAAENTDTAVVNHTTQSEINDDTTTTESAKAQTNENDTTSKNEPVKDTSTPQNTAIQQPSVDNQTNETETKPKPVAAPQALQTSEASQADAPKSDTQKTAESSTVALQTPETSEAKDKIAEPTIQSSESKVATEASAQPITNTSAPAPATNAHPVDKIEGIHEQVYAKEITVYEKSNAAKTAQMSRGIYQARESLGLIVPQNKKFYIRQAQGSNEADLRVDLMTNDSHTIRNATVSKNGSWTQISTTMDSSAFIRIPTGLTKKPVVEYYVEGDAGVTLPTYRKGGDKVAFDADWAARDTSYGYVDGDKIAFLVPKVDREHIADLGKNPGKWGFTDLDDMIDYYEDVITHYDKWVGLNDDINSVHYNVGQKYFTIADAHGLGLAYYSPNNMGSNSPSMSGYLQKGWLALHEVGHGYDGVMIGDPKMNLVEIENNILANQYQTTIMGVENGWAYEGKQESMQKDFHDRVMSGKMNFYNAGFRGSLDFMTKMVRLTGMEGFTDMWKGIRQEEADKNAAGKPFEQDVPRWITTYWLADHHVNGTAYFDLYKIQMPQTLKNNLDTYNNTFIYPLAALITNPEEQQRIKEKLGLSTIYELVKSSDLADTMIHEDAQVHVNLNGQVLSDHVKVSLMEGTQEVASANVVDGKAAFSNLRPGVYKIVAPLSTTNALPESEYLVVREGADNQVTLDYPKKDGVQNNVTQTISIRGLSNWEMATVSYNPETKQVTYKQNSGAPHVYFKDEYAHVTIQKADGTTVLDKSLIGNKNLSSELQTFDLDYGDKVIVRHREPVDRRVLVRNESKDRVVLSNENTRKETLTYTLTDKGFMVDGETQSDVNRRYDEAISADVKRVAEEIKNYPDRDYRTALFNVLTGVEYADPSVKSALLQTLNPLIAVYQVDSPTVNKVEAGVTSISGTGEPASTITITFENGKKAEAEVDKNGQWTIQLPEETTLKHNDVTQLYATGKHGTVSETISVKALDTVAPEIPVINMIEAGTKEVSGTSEPLSTVTLTLPEGTTKVVNTDNKGNWLITLETPLAHNEVIKAMASDIAGNKSLEATQTVKDTVAPKAPVVNEIKSIDQSVNGTAEPNSDVFVVLSNDKVLQTKADAGGNWKVELPDSQSLIGNETVKVYVRDLAENQSDTVESKVMLVEEPVEPETPIKPEEEKPSTDPETSTEDEPEEPLEPELETPTEPTPEDQEEAAPTDLENTVEEIPEAPTEAELENPTESGIEVTPEVPEEEATLTDSEISIEEPSEVYVDETTLPEETSSEIPTTKDTLEESEVYVGESTSENNEVSREITSEISSQDDLENAEVELVENDNQNKKATSLNTKTPMKKTQSKTNKQTLPKTGDETSSTSLLGSLLALLGLGFIVRRFNKKKSR